METNKYRSKQSILINLIAIVPILGGILWPLVNGYQTPALWVILIPTLVFVTTILWGINYRIEAGLLKVRIAFWTTWRIDIQKIKSINRSFNALSSPASSLKRIQVAYEGGQILLSPANEELFIKELLRTNPDIWMNLEYDNSSWKLL